MSKTNLVDGLKAQVARAEKAQSKIDKIDAKMEALSAQREEIVSEFAVNAKPTKLAGRPAGSKNKAAKSESKRGRAPNGAILPFLLKNVSSDKDNPTTLMDLEAAHSKMKNPITNSVRPKVIFMQGLKSNGTLFKKIAHGEYVLTAKGETAKAGEKVAKVANKAKAKAPKTAKTADATQTETAPAA